MALQTQPYKGARDFYPEDKRLQKYMFNKLREAVEGFGYAEYDAPLLEPLEIYTAKTGDEIVNEQTYVFEDRGGRKVVVRPEMTPSVSRMVAGRRQELTYPLRLFNIGTRWRYERPQKGRSREFYQLDADIFGIDSLDAEMEIIQVADAVLKVFGASRNLYQIKVNSRLAMKELLLSKGFDEDATPKIIGLFDRTGKDSFKPYLEKNFNPGDAKKLEDFVENTGPAEILSTKSGRNLSDLVARLKEVGIDIEVDMAINRGFDYYTDIVFEVFDTNPDNNRSLFGGGRYDGLVGLFGVEPLAAVGFAMGDLTLTNFLEENNLLPKLLPETDLFAVSIGQVAEKANKVVAELREMGLNVATDFTDRKMDKRLKNIDKNGVNYVLFIGENELKDEQFTLKDLSSGKEEKHSLQRIVSVVKDYRKK